MVDSQQRNDGFLSRELVTFANNKSGYNTSCDTANNNFDILLRRNSLSEKQLSTIYRNFKLIQKIVDCLPKTAGKLTPKVEDVASELDAEQLRHFDVKLRKLKFHTAIVKASILCRIYGDAFIILGIDDGGSDLSREVNEDNIKDIVSLLVRDINEVTPQYRTGDEIPDYYDYHPLTMAEMRGGEPLQRIHPSRILHFKGKELPRLEFFNNRYRNDSIIQSLLNSALNYVQGVAAGNSMLIRSGIFVYKMFGLEEMAAAEDTEQVQKRLTFIDLGISVFKSLFIDANTEESAEYVSQNFSGADKLLAALQDFLIAESEYPRSIILGSSNSSAFSEGGESDRLAMAELVSTYQKYEWLPHYEHILYLLTKSASMPALVRPEPETEEPQLPNRNTDSPDEEEPEDDEIELTVSFPSSMTLTLKEQAELRKIHSEADNLAITSGILMPQEIRISHYGNDEYNPVISIDPTLDVEEMKAEKEEEERAFQRETMEMQIAARQQQAQSNQG